MTGQDLKSLHITKQQVKSNKIISLEVSPQILGKKPQSCKSVNAHPEMYVRK